MTDLQREARDKLDNAVVALLRALQENRPIYHHATLMQDIRAVYDRHVLYPPHEHISVADSNKICIRKACVKVQGVGMPVLVRSVFINACCIKAEVHVPAQQYYSRADHMEVCLPWRLITSLSLTSG